MSPADKLDSTRWSEDSKFSCKLPREPEMCSGDLGGSGRGDWDWLAFGCTAPRALANAQSPTKKPNYNERPILGPHAPPPPQLSVNSCFGSLKRSFSSGVSRRLLCSQQGCRGQIETAP